MWTSCRSGQLLMMLWLAATTGCQGLRGSSLPGASSSEADSDIDTDTDTAADTDTDSDTHDSCLPFGCCNSPLDCESQTPKPPTCADSRAIQFWSCEEHRCELDCAAPCGYGGNYCPHDGSTCRMPVFTERCEIDDAAGVCLAADEPTCTTNDDCHLRFPQIRGPWSDPPEHGKTLNCVEGECVYQCTSPCNYFGERGSCPDGWSCRYPEWMDCPLDVDPEGLCLPDSEPDCNTASDCGRFDSCPEPGFWECNSNRCEWYSCGPICDMPADACPFGIVIDEHGCMTCECYWPWFCLDREGQLIPGCGEACGGPAMLECPDESLLCTSDWVCCLVPPVGQCLPMMNLQCGDGWDCEDLPAPTGCAGAATGWECAAYPSKPPDLPLPDPPGLEFRLWLCQPQCEP